MGPLQFTDHLLSFIAPALAVALGVAFGARWLRIVGQPLALALQFAINFTVGLAVLAAGLWHFGVDGKMATYAALALMVASVQWLCGRGWKR